MEQSDIDVHTKDELKNIIFPKYALWMIPKIGVIFEKKPLTRNLTIW